MSDVIEGLSLRSAEFPVAERLSAEQRRRVIAALSAMDGVERAELRPGSVAVEYYPDFLSRQSIETELVRLGLPPRRNGKKRNPFRRFVDRLAQSNAETFGSEPLDCCKLNSEKRSRV